MCLDGKRNDQMAFHALADYQNHGELYTILAIQQLQKARTDTLYLN